MRSNLHKSKTDILSSSKIRNCIQSISLTSARKREKEKKLSDKERRIETLQNQILHHVAETFKRVSIKTLKAETFTSSLHVHLNMLQDKITLCSWVNNHMQKIRQACKLIHAHLMNVNHIISCSFVIKKVMLLNNSI